MEKTMDGVVAARIVAAVWLAQTRWIPRLPLQPMDKRLANRVIANVRDSRQIVGLFGGVRLVGQSQKESANNERITNFSKQQFHVRFRWGRSCQGFMTQFFSASGPSQLMQ